MLVASEVLEDDLRAIVLDDSQPWAKRAAAGRMIRAVEFGDLADFAALLRGETTLEELKASGVNTEVVKRFRRRARRVRRKGGGFDELVYISIELYDRSGADFDRVIHHTDGTPTQCVRVDADVNSEVRGDGLPSLVEWIQQQAEISNNSPGDQAIPA